MSESPKPRELLEFLSKRVFEIVQENPGLTTSEIQKLHEPTITLKHTKDRLQYLRHQRRVANRGRPQRWYVKEPSYPLGGRLPEIRYYTVTQEREIKVSANSPIDAAVLANRVFSNTKYPEDQVNVKMPIRERALNVREDYS